MEKRSDLHYDRPQAGSWPVILSGPSGRTDFDFHDLCRWPSYTIVGAHNSSTPQYEMPGNPWTWHRHAESLFDLLASGEIALAPLVSRCEPHTHALGALSDAVARSLPGDGRRPRLDRSPLTPVLAPT